MTTEVIETLNEDTHPDRMTRRQVVVMKATGVVLNTLSYVAPGIAGRLAAFLWFTPLPFVRPVAPQIPPGAHRTTFGSGESVVHGYELGDGPLTALLIHGWAGSSRQYRRMALRLVDEGYRCVVIDLPGHGIEAGRSTDIIEFAEAVETAGDAIGKIDIVVAHSFGAIATSIAMQSSLRADRLVFVAPALRPHKVLESFAANLQLRPVLIDALEQTMEARFGEDLWDRIPSGTLTMEIPERTLLIHDLDDHMVPIEESGLLSEGWDVKVTTTQGHGHNGVLRATEVIDQITSLAATESALR